LADARITTFCHQRSYVPSCAGRIRSRRAASGSDSGMPTAAGFTRRGDVMLSDKETRFLEAAVLVAVPVCVAITAMIAILTLAGI